MPATDLAPIYDMLTACGFTLTRSGTRPMTHFYARDVAGQRINVAVYPRGNAAAAPDPAAPCVRVWVVVDLRQVWEAVFHAGTPASVVIAAISAGMTTAMPAVLPDPVHHHDVFSRIAASTHD